MPLLNVNVKWGREVYPNIEMCTDNDPDLFKAQLFTLTGVQPHRQRVMVKGKTLADNWAGFPVTNGMTVLLMGSKEEDLQVVENPQAPTKFLEDMNEAELVTAMELPVGLANLGNTCYLNATVQCLKTVKPLLESLREYVTEPAIPRQPANSITAAMRDIYRLMDEGKSVPPLVLLQAVHTAFPRFAERIEGGGWAQQDANECFVELVRVLQQKLPARNHSAYASVVDQYFGGRLAVTWKCNEAEEEAPTTQEENFLQLSCFITPEVKYIHSGLKGKLEEKVTKRSPTLDKDAEYTKISKIERLPAYLTIQMVRFFYKEQKSINAKILKDVKFPLEFDAFDLCSKELQEKLIPMRAKFKEYDDEMAEKGKVSKPGSGDKKKDEDVNYEPFSFHDDLGSNNSGLYELQAVLTHKGRSSSSGHYVAWVRHKGDIWIKCDDDEVSAVTAEEILKLSGGGDWHVAYVLIYGPRVLQLKKDGKAAVTGVEKMQDVEMSG